MIVRVIVVVSVLCGGRLVVGVYVGIAPLT